MFLTRRVNKIPEAAEDISRYLELKTLVLPDIDYFLVCTLWLLHGKRAQSRRKRKFKCSNGLYPIKHGKF